MKLTFKLNTDVMNRGDHTEQAILKAAEAEFLDKGFALAKTAEIARASPRGRRDACHVALLFPHEGETV